MVGGWRQSLNRWLVQVNPGLMMAKVTILDIWYYCLQAFTFYTLVPYFCFKLNERTDIKINQKSKNVWKIEFHQLSTFITTTHGSVWWRYKEMVSCVLSSVTLSWFIVYFTDIYLLCYYVALLLPPDYYSSFLSLTKLLRYLLGWAFLRVF